MKEMDVHEALAIALAVGLLTLILVPVSQDAFVHGWFAALREWQTLIAGSMAIAAAWYTVKQMRASDLRSDHRHEELVRIQLSTETRIVERAINPQRSDLAYALDDAFQKIEEIQTFPAGERVAPFSNEMSGLVEHFTAVVLLLRRTPFIDGAKLFTGTLSKFCVDLEEECMALIDQMGQVEKGLDRGSAPEAAKVASLIDDMLSTIEHGTWVIDGLDDIARRYAIVVDD